ncbi:hypothetical protein AWJ20_3841 [Sugiyamaella lignohabitans]|uniref:Uncharacterized protein n=1 Tax=Sugiyamaella lignohabitans TaxID=796027 RepID=A0A167C043_9ASCO|nr:uncharacterized protein AWJ20_3841 [Sugiyamaella lignohabitans]ANB11045.1 hypothetical protein AWJ20_3841 [Sugiyamaella lignohabitans]
MTSIINDTNLETKTNTEVRNQIFTGPASSSNHTLSTSGTKSTRNKNTISRAETAPGLVVVDLVSNGAFDLKIGSFDPNNLELKLASQSRVLKSLDNRNITVLKIGIFTDQGNSDLLETTVMGLGNTIPTSPQILTLSNTLRRQFKFIELKTLGKEFHQLLVVQKKRNMVSRIDIMDTQNLVRTDVTEHRDLVNSSLVKLFRTSTGNNIGCQTKGSQILDSSLSRFGLLLTMYNRNKRNVNQSKVLRTDSELKLT